MHPWPLYRRAHLPILGLLALMGGCVGNQGVRSTIPTIKPGDIAGRYVLVMGDADMNAGAVGPLFTRPPEVDQLTVIGLPIASSDVSPLGWNTRVAQVRAGNSVLGPPGAIAVTPDGMRAYVCEPVRPIPPGAQGPVQPEPGDQITPIDLTDPSQPAGLAPIRVGLSPVSVDVHPGGEFVAVGTAEPGQQIALLRVGREDETPLAFPLLGIDDERAEVGAIAWHPTGRYLAVALPARRRVVLYEFSTSQENALPALAPWGEPVTLPARPLAIRFTPGGRHLLVTCAGAPAEPGQGPLPASDVGELVVVALSDVPTQTNQSSGELGITVAHSISDNQPLGQMPEGLAVGPDGVSVAVASWGSQAQPARGPARPQGGEVRLFSLSPRTGRLSPLAQRPARGVPTGVAFDTSGKHLLVAQLRSTDPSAIDGELTFFRIARTVNKTTLYEAGFVVGIGAGPHGNLIVK
jgi:hypothetical protein